MEYSSQEELAYDGHLEESTLGAILLQPDRLTLALSEAKLRDSSFYFDKNKEVFRVISKLYDQGTPPNEALVSSELNGTVPQGYVYQLTGNCSTPSEVVHYAKRLVELEQWRRRRLTSMELVMATGQRDLEKFAKAKGSLDDDEIRSNSLQTAEQLGTTFTHHIEEESFEVFSLPYKKFNMQLAGGLRRKQMSLLGGWSSHGKSVIIDQWLEHFAKEGHNCHLYLNEMGIEDRVARSISRNTEVPYSNLMRNDLNGTEKDLVTDILSDGCPYFAMTECAGWSISELAYDIKSRQFDVIGVDILHLFDYDSENELARISRLLNRTAKQANCHIIATVHLNEYRVNDVVRPRPVLRDIRGSGMLKNDADNVIFIQREQSPSTGDPMSAASIYMSKVRNGMMGAVPLIFNGGSFSFTEASAY